MPVPATLALSTSPAKKPPMLTVAPNNDVLSVSATVADAPTVTGVLLVEAGLLTLSVKVLVAAASAKLGALSNAKPWAAIGVTVLVAIEVNSVGARVLLRLPL